MTQLSKSAAAVQAALRIAGVSLKVVELPSSTRTAKEAAASIGCTVAQIAKSIVFRAESGKPVLVVASGVNRIDPIRVESSLGEPVKMAAPEFVRESTGFAIGGVPPCGHPVPITTLVDRDLLELETLWAAAGTPHAVFSLAPGDLVRLTGGTVIAVG